MAIACLGSVTVFPERPLLSWPRFISCMARSTFLLAFLPYLAICLPSFLSERLSPGGPEIDRKNAAITRKNGVGRALTTALPSMP